MDSYDAFNAFIETVAGSGCDTFIVHARKAWLKGLSPKENREVPPLDYDLVVAMKARFPNLHISINGGAESIDKALEFLDIGLDGVMIGRAAYHSPWDILGDADRRVFGGENPLSCPEEAVLGMIPYIEAHLAEGGRLHAVTRHMLGLYHGCHGGRHWRRMLSEDARKDGANIELLREALQLIEQAAATRAAAE